MRKLVAELSHRDLDGTVVVTNGGIDSNHCRTLAWLGARYGFPCHLVLHHEGGAEDRRALDMLRSLGASYSLVQPAEIPTEIAQVESEIARTEKSLYNCRWLPYEQGSNRVP